MKKIRKELKLKGIQNIYRANFQDLINYFKQTHELYTDIKEHFLVGIRLEIRIQVCFGRS